MKWRFKVFYFRLLDYIITLPGRFIRFLKWLLWLQPLYGSHQFTRWFIGLLLLIIDLTPIPLLLECILDFFKLKTRGLNSEEMQLAKSVFENNLPYHLIGMDPGSIPVSKKRMVAFVTFHTINFERALRSYIFIHELVHIWQYRKYGAVYISEAMWAQHWGGGYNYGGKESLLKNYEIGLPAFNYEQQAEIIEDYFRIINDLPLQWSVNDPEIKMVLERYVYQLRENRLSKV